MPLTISNASTLVLLNALNRTSNQHAVSLQRLATGRRINSAADDPAGLIALQQLSRDQAGIDAAIGNVQRASGLLSTADGALTQINALLTDIEGLVAQSANSAGLSQSEIAANQAQIDAAVDSIDRIVNSTAFNGARLLDGTQAIRTTLDGTAASDLSDVRIFSRRSSTSAESLAVNVLSTARVASAVIATPSVVSAASISISGKLGTATVTINAGQALSSIVARVVQAAGETGVSARLSGSTLIGVTRELGATAFLSVSRISGDADFQNVARTSGADAVVTVGGQTITADGLTAHFGINGLSGQLSLTSAGNVLGSAGVITITGGGATFQLGTQAGDQSTLGINPLGSGSLGGADVGYLNQLKSGGSASLAASSGNALAITRRAAAQAANAQSRVGGFQAYAVTSALNSLSSRRESVESTRAAIDDVDYAEESSRLTRHGILMQGSLQLLGIVNQQAEMLLTLF